MILTKLWQWFLGRKGLNACTCCISSFQVQAIPLSLPQSHSAVHSKGQSSWIQHRLLLFCRFSHARLYETWGWRSDGHIIITPQNRFRRGLCVGVSPRMYLPEPAGSMPSSHCCGCSTEQGCQCSPQQLLQQAWLPCLTRDHPGEDHAQLRHWERGIWGKDVRSCKAQPPCCLLQKLHIQMGASAQAPLRLWGHHWPLLKGRTLKTSLALLLCL